MYNKLNDNLIENLVDDLKPCKPLNIWSLIGVALLAATILSLLVISVIGIREDFINVLKSGAIAWKNGGLLLIAIGALVFVINNSRPITQKMGSANLLFLLLDGIIIYQILKLVLNGEFNYEITNINFGSFQTCVSIILAGGGIVYFALWHLWLKKSASMRPEWQSTMTGVFAGAIAAFAYAFHCNMDSIFYFIICYLSPIIILGGVGYIFGSRLKW